MLLDSTRPMPDILDTIANLSNDEVFTPPRLANQILDILPAEVWRDPNLKWLDPACKTGVFLREIAKRLMIGLKEIFPDENARRNHIFKNMLYGLPITSLTALMSRRSVYTSKIADGEFSVVKFDDDQGNIRYLRSEHTFKKEQCIFCGINEKNQYDRGDDLENYAYQFIHNFNPNNMKFDVIIGNPPYQLKDEGFGASAVPIYHKFVQQARKLNPKYFSFIIPSRWFAGGKGLDDFRAEMLADNHIKTLVDYPNASDCFPGVEIKGGVCYLLWDKNHSGDCTIKSMSGDEIISEATRSLGSFEVFVRHNQAISILEKIQVLNEPTLDKKVSSRKPFGFATDFKSFEEKQFENSVKIYSRGRQGYLEKSKILINPKWIDKYKVILAMAAEGKGVFPNNIIGKSIVVDKNTCCTETYLVIDAFDEKNKAENLAEYLKTRLVRFLISLKKNTQHISKDRFSFVPDLDMNILWTDEMLFKKYKLDDQEIEFIKSIVKEM